MEFISLIGYPEAFSLIFSFLRPTEKVLFARTCKDIGKIFPETKKIKLRAESFSKPNLFEYLKQCNYPITLKASSLAVIKGNLELLKWLRSKGAPWDEWTFAGGCTKEEYLEILKWMRAQGAPWSKRAFYVAAENENLEILKWLEKEGCPCGMKIFDLIWEAKTKEWLEKSRVWDLM